MWNYELLVMNAAATSKFMIHHLSSIIFAVTFNFLNYRITFADAANCP
jgi:hypothetical protein